ncbi:MAG: hypothetical protein IT299_00235 [Dehalococcoidia bacterium]|nr:hypothetical protein [Dehalococcoidia bacterium]
MAFIPPVSPGHVDPEAERYNARSRIQSTSVWEVALRGLQRLLGRAVRLVRRERDPFRW